MLLEQPGTADISYGAELEWKPFPVAALPPAMQTIVEGVAQATGTEPAYAALAAMVTVAGCVGNRAAITLRGGWSEPCVLWGALVGRSGTTKSPALKAVTRPLITIYKEARAKFAEQLEEYEQAYERFRVDLSRWKSARRNGDSESDTDDAPPTPPTPPSEARVLIKDVTIEKVGALLTQNPLGLLLVRDELAAWIGSFDRYSHGKGGDQPNWLSMADATDIQIDRKGAAATLFVERAAVSVIGTIQPGIMARAFGRKERDSGLLARLLVVLPPARVSRWTDASLSDEVAKEWLDLIRALLNLPHRDDGNGNPQPHFLGMTEDAKAIWVPWHDSHVRETLEVEDEDLAQHFSKLKGICPRFALILACVDAAARGDRPTCVDADAMRRAIELVEWFKHEARRVYAHLDQDAEVAADRLLIEYIRARGGSITPSELTQNRRKRYPTTEEAETVLDGLADAGLGSWVIGAPGSRGGRPSKRFVLGANETPDGDGSEGVS